MKTRMAGVMAILTLLAGCTELLDPTQPPTPILVTLPASTPQPATPTAEPSPTSETPIELPTSEANEAVAPTPIPQASGIGSTKLLWEWREVARPSALAAGGERLAALIADGRFAWLNAGNGRIESSSFVWSGVPQGETWGEVYVDGLGTFALAAIREQRINVEWRAFSHCSLSFSACRTRAELAMNTPQGECQANAGASLVEVDRRPTRVVNCS